ncbi:MAG: outer membrane beta-barrel protein [Algibacter sp.]
MISNLKPLKKTFFATACMMCWFIGLSQGDTSTFKAQIALGLNSPSKEGFVSTFESKSINLPTVNLGVQYMFKPKLGAKLDFGFNRLSNLDNTPEFKINYTRINAQLVYNASRLFGYLPQRIGVFPHAGPGFAFVTPLAGYLQNKTSFLNVMGGLEFHYGLSDTVSAYVDTSYILGFADDFSPVSSGFGSFNGNILTVTVGLSLSLSGCYYCQRHE